MDYKKLEKRAFRFLNRKEVKEFKQFDEAKQKRILDVFTYDEAMFKSNVEAMFNDTFEYPSELEAWKQKQEVNRTPTFREQLKQDNEKIREDEIKGLAKKYSKLGISEPSEVTLDVLIKQDVYANSTKVFNKMGVLTTDLHKQLQSIYYNTQLKQNIVTIAQNDETIKQNNKIIEQNDLIIELLTDIKNK